MSYIHPLLGLVRTRRESEREQSLGTHAQNSEDWVFHNATTGNDEQKLRTDGNRDLKVTVRKERAESVSPNQVIRKEDKHDQIEFKETGKKRGGPAERWHND